MYLYFGTGSLRKVAGAALNCWYVHGCRQSAANTRTSRIRAALAGAEAAVSRGGWRGVCGAGTGMDEFRAARLDARRCPLADRCFHCGCFVVCGICGEFVSPRPAIVRVESRWRAFVVSHLKKIATSFAPESGSFHV